MHDAGGGNRGEGPGLPSPRIHIVNTSLDKRAHFQGSFPGLISRAHFQGSFPGLISRAHFQGSFPGLISRAIFNSF